MALQVRDHSAAHGGRPAPLKSTVNLPLSFRSSYKQEDDQQQEQDNNNNSNWKSSSHLLSRTAKGELPLVAHHEDKDEDEDDEEEEQSETSSIGDCSSADEEEEEEQEELSKPNTSNNNQQHEYSPFSLANANAHDDQSSKKSSLSSLDSLEDSLPFKRGLSNFYSGKSKSFTSLSTAANATAKDIVKPENPLNKRRRLFIARSRNRRASCTSLVSIAEAECPYPFLPLLPSVLSECDDEEDEDDDDDNDEEAEESIEQASPSSQSSEQQQPRSMMRRSRTEKRRPSLFTVSVTPFEARPDLDSFLTPKSVRGGSGNTKLALKSPGRSYSLSDLSRHPQLARPMHAFND